jgi:alanyl-tRNA synthetase
MVTPDEVKGHTAIHVLKGAVVYVLGRGAKWSASAYSQGIHGGLAVQFDREPTDEELTRIEEAANQKIMENSTIEVYEMNRSDAEARWGDDIYDLFPLPAELRVVKVLRIPDWNVNTCGKQHCTRTGELGGLKIAKWRYRFNKKLLEMSFNVTGINASG